jgi:glycosyltransferase involved in cell wall biosynthesis
VSEIGPAEARAAAQPAAHGIAIGGRRRHVALIAPGIWQTVHWDFARALAALGHRVTVYTEDRSAPSGRRFLRETRDGIDCYVISDSRRNPLAWPADRLFKPLLGRRFFTTLSAVRRFLRAVDDADVRLVEGDWMGVFAALSKAAAHRRWIVSIHDTLYLRAPIDYPGRPRSRWRERLKLWVLRRASAVRANSGVTRDALVQGGCAPDKIFVVPLPIAAWMRLPPGMPLHEFRERARRVVRESLDIAADAPLYMVMCRLDPAKGLELAVEAFAQCGQADARLVICGGDRELPGVGSYRATLEAIARRLGVQDRVIFTGHVAVGDVKRHLAAADLHLAPSVIDTFNYGVVEAAMVGTPSLMSMQVGAAPWIVAAGGGETLSGREPAAWGARMAALTAAPPEPGQRRAMSESIQQALAPETVARHMLDALARAAPP